MSNRIAIAGPTEELEVRRMRKSLCRRELAVVLRVTRQFHVLLFGNGETRMRCFGNAGESGAEVALRVSMTGEGGRESILPM